MVERLVKTVPVNERQEIRIRLEDCRGQQFVSVRMWFRARDGSMRPGKQGLNVKLTLLPGLAAAMRRAVFMAKAQGLIAESPPYARDPEDTSCAGNP